jgi:hypothetical protein
MRCETGHPVCNERALIEVPQKEVRLPRTTNVVGRIISPGERRSRESTETRLPQYWLAGEAKKTVCESEKSSYERRGLWARSCK